MKRQTRLKLARLQSRTGAKSQEIYQLSPRLFRFNIVGSKFRIPILVKLVVATAAVIAAVVIPLAIKSSEMFEETFRKSQQDANAELAFSKATEANGLLLGYVEKIRTATNFILKEDGGSDIESLDLMFARDLDLVNVEIYHYNKGKIELYLRKTNEEFFKEQDLNKTYVDRVRREVPVPVSSIFTQKDKIHIQNSSLPRGVALFTVGVPFPDQNGVVKHVAIADIRLDRLQKAFSHAGVRVLFLVDSNGQLLAHSDDRLVLEGKNLGKSPIVEEAMKATSVSSRGQKTRYLEPESNEWFVGAYCKTAFGPSVIAQAPEKFILEPARTMRVEAFTIAGYVLSAAFFLVVVFSLTITTSIEELNEAAEGVGRGNFEIKAKVNSFDEIADLAIAFNSMVEGLKERDKVKTMFSKFHGSSITEDLLKGNVSLGGSRKQVTVFFSDIRGFTKYSEHHTPEEVVEMLNEYFQVMVGIITANHGVVDKFVGDAIMAVWGAPQTTGADPMYAVKACLEMRVALAKLNDERMARGQEAIKIGMGVHSGEAISGTIGSTERMEYTVIGDTVNMASRIEASTKAFGADILLSELTAHAVADRFIVEEAGSAEVKGKAVALKLMKVRGFIDAAGNPVEVRTPYSDYTSESADKIKISA
jgi:adenylate cyclase